MTTDHDPIRVDSIMNASVPSPEELDHLRGEHYNATVTRVRHVHDALMILRVRPDAGKPEFTPGQYTLLGLGWWERRVDGILPSEPTNAARQPLVRRAYSICCPLLDESGRLVTAADGDFLEFYVTLVRRSADSPPMLTPRLFSLAESDRLFVGLHPHGRYSLAGVEADDTVLFISTGTGEAPHNAMLAELLARSHSGRIVMLSCVRYRRDLAYLDVHRKIERQYANYQYLTLTTREPENLDPSHPGYVGKQYVQEVLASGRFERETGVTLDSRQMHAFLCGSPAMIGYPDHDRDGRQIFPEPTGTVEVLIHRGFQLDEPDHPGNLHVEKYW